MASSGFGTAAPQTGGFLREMFSPKKRARRGWTFPVFVGVEGLGAVSGLTAFALLFRAIILSGPWRTILPPSPQWCGSRASGGPLVLDSCAAGGRLACVGMARYRRS
jgi:hypothetical protein